MNCLEKIWVLYIAFQLWIMIILYIWANFTKQAARLSGDQESIERVPDQNIIFCFSFRKKNDRIAKGSVMVWRECSLETGEIATKPL